MFISKTGDFHIVDWDNPILAPKERDLMFIGGGVGGVWNRKFQEELFYQGYGSSSVNLALLAYYRHNRILEDIAIYAQELMSVSTQESDRKLIFKYLVDMFQPGNVLEMAFKTVSKV